MGVTKVFGREQAMWLGLVAGVVGVLTGFGIEVSPHLQGIITAVIVFVFGVYNAVKLHDGLNALVSHVALALFALLAAFGLNWSDHKQALVLGGLALVTGFITRQLSTNPIPPTVSPAGVLVDKGAA
jgi:UDP-N-acetylmuramyl pentapeptide phosphotransferase/UDP-N-acetylglucosamine-1-phosphate transferase